MKFSFLSVGGAVAYWFKKKKQFTHHLRQNWVHRMKAFYWRFRLSDFCKFFNIVAILVLSGKMD